MARIRTVKPEFFRHEGLFELEQETGWPMRVAFAGLWTSADREGRFKWKPRQLKLDCLPFDELDFSRVLDALMTRGFIVQYEVSGEILGFIPSWHEHQIINNRESDSTLPVPTESSIKSTTSTRDPRVADACTTRLEHASVEGKGREGKGKEGKETTRRVPDPSFPKPDDVTQQVWDDHLKIRKAKKLPMTQTAFEEMSAQIAKTGLTLEGGLRYACGKNWASFDATWYFKDNPQAAPAGSSDPEWRREQRARTQQAAPGVAVRDGIQAGDFFEVESKTIQQISIGATS